MAEEPTDRTATTANDTPIEAADASGPSSGPSRRQYLQQAGFVIGSSVVAGRVSSRYNEPTENGATGVTPDRTTGNDYYPSNRAPLRETPFVELPLGSVNARGWLQGQLQGQKDGLTGSAEELYDALSENSGWLGGDSMGWERAPYYVKGLVPLAYTLDDEELITTAKKWVNGVLGTQRENGGFGPPTDFPSYWWPRMIVLSFLRDYYAATGDGRIIPFLRKYFHHQAEQLPERPLKSWATARGADNIAVVLWLYNITGEQFLLELAETLRSQTTPWSHLYTENLFEESDHFGTAHIVNVAQALKFPPVVWQLTGDEQDRTAMQDGIDHLTRQYGRIDGQFSGTEELSSKRSTAGVELDASVERMLSQAEGIRIFGDARLGDQLEKVAYNAFPASVSTDMHQISYYQLPNQVASEHENHGFRDDHLDDLMASPHSGYPCCCYNWHMGWPKFVQNLWAATHDNGLAAIAYGPSEVTATVGDGQEVTITEETGYPFRETIEFTISMSTPTRFPLKLRIPQWADDARIILHPGSAPDHARNDHGRIIRSLDTGSFYTLERPWTDGETVTLELPMTLRTSRWANDSVGIERGPLAFSLKIEETWSKYREFYQDFDAYEVTPASPWNYALQIDPDNPSADLDVKETPFDGPPFSPAHTPLSISATGKRIPDWTMTAPTQGIVILGEADGQWHEIERASESLLAAETHHLRVVVEGSTITVAVDGSTGPVLEATDDTHTTGTVGVRTYKSPASFTNITLQTLDGSTVPLADYADWQYYWGDWTINPNGLSVTAVEGGKAVAPDLRVSDFVMEADVTAGENGDAGLIFRVQNPTEQLDGYEGYYVGINAVLGEKSLAEEPPREFTPADTTEELILNPYGAGTLRVSYFPQL